MDKVTRQQEHARRVAALHLALEPPAAELQTIGVTQLSRLQTGVDTKVAPFPPAIPMLMARLDRDYPPDVRSFIAGCLQTPEARVGWDTLLRNYRKEPQNLVKDNLASALAAVAGEEQAETCVSWRVTLSMDRAGFYSCEDWYACGTRERKLNCAH